MCCSSGFQGSKLGEDCGLYGSSIITIITGPFDRQILNGLFWCCAGLKGVYTLRVYDFDTGVDTIVASN